VEVAALRRLLPAKQASERAALTEGAKDSAAWRSARQRSFRSAKTATIVCKEHQPAIFTFSAG
jgi:hypothetical protein